jgi:flagellar hook-basal body complex protein FliE
MIDGVSAMSATKSSLGSVDSLDSLGGDSDMATSAMTGSSSGSGSGSDFGTVMKQVVTDAIGTMEKGESTAIQGLQGAASPFKVVQAVMSAQRTLQSVISIRDKAVSAYQEITRMAI